MSLSIFDQNFYDLIFRVVYNATKAVVAFLHQDSVLYWPFLISTLLIAWMTWRFGRACTDPVARTSWRAFFQRHLGRSLWWHPSARVDYRFYLINAVIFPLLVGPFLFGDASVAIFLNGTFGLTPTPAVSGVSAGMVATLCFTVLFFVAYDLGRFLAHSLLHDVPFLWEFHKVHHSAEVLTPMTSFRAHPIDLLVMAWGGALTTGVATWLFHRFVNSGITFYSFLGLHVLIWMFSLIGNLRHSQVWLSYGKTLNRWLISPAHHQLHHSAEARHWGCNRGFELAIWDRLYGTLCVPSDKPETFRFGLGDDTDGRWRSLGKLYFWPFRLLVRRIGVAFGSRGESGKR
jgi:sterol desaturase/sphingolipid hydroxylase (fatty acid hydroxylase superfamily)